MPQRCVLSDAVSTAGAIKRDGDDDDFSTVLILADAQTAIVIECVGKAIGCAIVQPNDAARAIGAIAVSQGAGEVGGIWGDITCTTGVATR